MLFIKKKFQVYFYDINETYTDIHVKKLYVLEQTFVEEKCGIIHCCMDKLIPLGVSDKKWSKFSCDRLIEKLTKYPYVYFAKKVRTWLAIVSLILFIFNFSIVGEKK